jgi:hypothetical protein
MRANQQAAALRSHFSNHLFLTVELNTIGFEQSTPQQHFVKQVLGE